MSLLDYINTNCFERYIFPEDDQLYVCILYDIQLDIVEMTKLHPYTVDRNGVKKFGWKNIFGTKYAHCKESDKVDSRYVVAWKPVN